MSSTPLAPSVNYKLLQTWEEEDGMEEEEEEEDLNLNGNGIHKMTNSSLHDYVKKISQRDLEGHNGGRQRNAWPSHGNKRGLMAALGVAVVLMVMLVSVVVYVNNQGGSSTPEVERMKQRLVSDLDETNNITLSDILSGTYGSRGNNGTWISPNEIQYFDSSSNVIIYNVVTKVAQTFINSTLFDSLLFSRPSEVIISPDRQFALVGYDSQKVYRHSFYAKYAIFYNETQDFQQIIPGENLLHNLLQLVQWSPVGNAVAFVYENNVYYLPSTARGTRPIQLTTTGGQQSQIFHGVTDWVYEEEMFSSFKAVWFSPDGKNLAFATFNDTEVRQIQYTLYGNPGQFPLFQYPIIESIAYPKAGTTNPTATISIVTNLNELRASETITLNFGVQPDLSYYIGTALWATNTELLVVTLNRPQNNSETLLCTATRSPCKPILTRSQPNGWIDINTPKVSQNGEKFLMIDSVNQGSRTYRHIVQFNRDHFSPPTPITSGNFAVDSISGWDENDATNVKIYYMSTGHNATTNEAFPNESHLYVVSHVGEPSQKIDCLTCELQNQANNVACLVNGADLSTNFQNIIHTCSGPSVPEVVIRSIDSINQIQHVWEGNVDLNEKMESVVLPKIQDYDIPVANGFTAKARLWLPPNYEKGKKYPLLVDVYGGPASQKITQRFGIDWGTSLVSSKNVIYASIDGRGSGRQSDEQMFELYRKLGTVEIEDQIAATKWLIEHNTDNVIDANKTAIWGWSYGGYATAMVMGTDTQGIFKCGISVAPVTSWTFYDTIYTERYMGLPTPNDNLVSYNSSDVTNHIQNFRTKKYYLIHGNADDNVHYQQSMLLSRALERADILFRQQSYPDENHGLGSVRRHLYHSLENFLFKECWA